MQISLERSEIHTLCNALNEEAQRFEQLVLSARAAPITPGAIRYPEQTLGVWKDHIEDLQVLRNYLLSGRRTRG